jgi:hypothetical protein
MMCCHMSKDLSSISYVFKPVGYFCVFHPLTTEPENVTMLNSQIQGWNLKGRIFVLELIGTLLGI